MADKADVGRSAVIDGEEDAGLAVDAVRQVPVARPGHRVAAGAMTSPATSQMTARCLSWRMALTEQAMQELLVTIGSGCRCRQQVQALGALERLPGNARTKSKPRKHR